MVYINDIQCDVIYDGEPGGHAPRIWIFGRFTLCFAVEITNDIAFWVWGEANHGLTSKSNPLK